MSINLEQTYKDNRDRIMGRVCQLIGENSQVCEDIVSEIFLDLTRFVRSGKFRGDSSLETVLFTITDRRVADYWRTKYRGKGHFLKMAMEAAGLIKRPKEPAVYGFEFNGLFTKIWDSLEVLDENERNVFVERCLLGRDVVSVVDSLGLSEEFVKKLYSLAKKKLAMAIRSSVRGDAATLPNRDKKEWLDKFYGAYLRLGEKSGYLTDGMKLAAGRAYSALSQDLEKK